MPARSSPVLASNTTHDVTPSAMALAHALRNNVHLVCPPTRQLGGLVAEAPQRFLASSTPGEYQCSFGSPHEGNAQIPNRQLEPSKRRRRALGERQATRDAGCIQNQGGRKRCPAQLSHAAGWRIEQPGVCARGV